MMFSFAPPAIFTLAPLFSVRVKQVLLIPVTVGMLGTPVVLIITFEHADGTMPVLQFEGVFQSEVIPSQVT
jgi:hypothetical protein